MMLIISLHLAFCGELSRLTKEVDHLKHDEGMTVPDSEDQEQDTNLWHAYNQLKLEMEAVKQENQRLREEAAVREAKYQDEFAAIRELKERMEELREPDLRAYSIESSAGGGGPAVAVTSHNFELHFQVGTPVEARRGTNKRWYVGTVSALHDDNTFDVEFRDGSVDSGVKRGCVRARIQGPDDIRKSPAKRPLVATVYNHTFDGEGFASDSDSVDGSDSGGGGSGGGFVDLAEMNDNEINLLLQLDRVKSQQQSLIQELQGTRTEMTECFEEIRNKQSENSSLAAKIAKSDKKIEKMQIVVKTVRREKEVAKRHFKIFSMSVESRVVNTWKGRLSIGSGSGSSSHPGGVSSAPGSPTAAGGGAAGAAALAAKCSPQTSGGWSGGSASAAITGDSKDWFQITGAGAGMVNGAYHMDGSKKSDGVARYKRVGADIYLSRLTGRWYVSYFGPQGNDAMSRLASRPSRIWNAPAAKMQDASEIVQDADFYSVGKDKGTQKGQGSFEVDSDRPPLHGWSVEELGVGPGPSVTFMPVEALGVMDTADNQ